MLQTDFSNFPEIKTERLFLRKITADDLDQLFLLRSSDQVMKYIDRPRAASITDAAALLQVIDNSLKANSGITWGITLKNNPSQLIGTIGFWRLIPEHFRAEIGYMLSPDYWQKGIMKEALITMIDYAFHVMKLHSIQANLNSGNVASARLLASAGFVKEAYFKEDFYFEGTFRDTIIYSIVNSK